MPIVDTTIPITAASADAAMLNLVRTYPFVRTELIATTAFERPVRSLIIGNGPRRVLFSAAHHANEWITALILLRFAEEFAQAIQSGGQIGGMDARTLQETATVYLVPMVNPDGVDLVVGAIAPDNMQYSQAQGISANFPEIPFPDDWKANLLGVDLNLNYPAGWLMAREIKFSQGYTRPAPRDYVGRSPLDQSESRGLAEYTIYIDPALVVAYHTQGREIYWQFKDIAVPGARELGEKMAQVSGYTLAQTPYASSFAGYKDWFIQEFRRPGYTVEAGQGVNPLPIAQFPQIYADNLPLLLTAITGIPYADDF